eukprot:344475-Hanusia_phi.AAC.1
MQTDSLVSRTGRSSRFLRLLGFPSLTSPAGGVASHRAGDRELEPQAVALADPPSCRLTSLQASSAYVGLQLGERGRQEDVGRAGVRAALSCSAWKEDRLALSVRAKDLLHPSTSCWPTAPTLVHLARGRAVEDVELERVEGGEVGAGEGSSLPHAILGCSQAAEDRVSALHDVVPEGLARQDGGEGVEHIADLSQEHRDAPGAASGREEQEGGGAPVRGEDVE